MVLIFIPNSYFYAMKNLEIVIFTVFRLMFYQKYMEKKGKKNTFSCLCFLYHATGSNQFLVISWGLGDNFSSVPALKTENMNHVCICFSVMEYFLF